MSSEVTSDTESCILIANCYYCKANVSATVLARHVNSYEVKTGDFAGEWHTNRLSLALCQVCKEPMLTIEGSIWAEEGVWPAPRRLWPLREGAISWKIPQEIRDDLVEAEICLNHGTFTASAIMSGRALEGLVRHFTTPTTSLKAGISELRQKDIIDDRLLEWAEMLHLERNDGAHASGRSFHELDARDSFEFSKAIAEYVFDISRRFEKFKARQQKRTQASHLTAFES